MGHIIALGGKSGAFSVWDLRKKSELIHIPTRYAVSSIAWHPTDQTLLVTASADDHNPVIQLWDLKNTNAPKATLSGHDRGVLSLSWCIHDPELLLSSGTDNRTLIWNPSQARVIAELPHSSQWVHQTSWCKTQPAVLANASLDGKILLYSIQDTGAKVVSAVTEDVAAGEDFFETLPKNFQAQSSSFSLQQTPRWLKCPIGATFGVGGRLVQFNNSSAGVNVVKYQVSTMAAQTAKEIKETLGSLEISELCQTARSESNQDEKQDWDVIETLTSEHARGALLKYLGYTKQEAEREVLTQLNKVLPTSIPSMESAEAKGSTSDEDTAMTDEKTAKPEEVSVFGDDAGEDDFLAAITSQSLAVSGNDTASGSSHKSAESGPFNIFPSQIDDLDKLITKAILTNQFDVAIDVCLSADRMSDAFMLALCGGIESQQKVQKAYFSKTKVPYARLLSSIIASDLRDIVTNADLLHWKEVLAILCNYAKPDDFPDLCEILGQRLDASDHDQAHATLCYLAGSKLDHLIRIWTTKQAQEDDKAFSGNGESAPFEIHAAGLGKLIKKVSIFRKAVSFNDSYSRVGDSYVLSSLYSKYLEFAGMIMAEGEADLALEYLDLVPVSMDGVEAMKNRLKTPTKVVQPAQPNIGKPLTGMRNVYTQPESANTNSNGVNLNRHAAPSNITMQNAVPRYGPSQTGPVASAPSQYAPAHAQMVQNPYSQQAATSYNSVPPQQPSYQPSNGAYGIVRQPQLPQQNAFAPPPSRIASAGPPILPAVQRKDITPWNDAPEIPQPAPRRATPLARGPITSPFVGQASPVLQGFGPQQQTALAPPPKSRSPAPFRPPAAPSTVAPPTRNVSSPYGPPESQASVNGNQAPLGSSYAPAPNFTQGRELASPHARQAFNPTAAGPALFAAHQQAAAPELQGPPVQAYSTFPPSNSSMPQQHFAGPSSSSQQAAFAPPPKSTGGPPKVSGSQAQSPVIRAPAVGSGVVLDRESSRPGSPARVVPDIPAAVWPAGDRSHIPPQDLPIVQNLSALLEKLKAISPEKYRRPLEDSDRRLSVLYDQLNNGQLSPDTVAQLHMLVSSLVASVWDRGYAVQVELTSTKMHEVREWIAGTKALFVIGKKSVEERWDTQVMQM